MDVTLLPPSANFSHHSHHIYHPLLPSALPRRRSPYHYTCPAPGSPFAGFSSYCKPQRHEPPPPPDGSCLLAFLPDEILLSVLGYLELDDLLLLRTVDCRFSNLALSSALHHSLTILTLPPSPLPTVLARHILPATRHLHLHLFPYPSPTRSPHPSTILLSLLQSIPPDQLKSLSLPFSSPYLPMSEMGEISRIGGKLERLDLRGSGLVGTRWGDWLKNVGAVGDGLRELDLGFTSISSLPQDASQQTTGDPLDRTIHIPPTPHPFRNLVSLSLASCSSLPAAVLSTFLATLPPTLEQIDLSRLDQITFPSLLEMRVTTYADEARVPTALREIKVVGIDHLTRLDIRRLKRDWEDQRRACFPKPVDSPSPIHTKRVWGVPRTPERHTIPLSPPGTPTPPGRKCHLQEDHPFYQASRSRTAVYRFGLPTPPPSLGTSPSSDLAIEISKTDPLSINIVHSAILESEDEAGYRQFIGEVVGGTLGVGLGLGWEEVQPHGEGWVVVDGGGVI